MALVMLHTIFQDAFPAYEQTHPLPAHVRQAAHAIMPCRTAALGGHSQACPNGHSARVWYNACRHRSCPPCASLQTERWLARQLARLLACADSQVICTLPHDRHARWLAKVPVMTPRLCQAVRDTLGPLLADPQSLGAEPGLLAALHPWSQPLLLHPPLHCVVTGGGRTPAGQWVAVRHGFLWPARVVMAVLRGTMLDAIRRACARGEVGLPETMRPQPWLTRLNRLGHPKQTLGNVRMMERYRHGAGVVPSLARSRRGGSIKNVRLVAWDGERVTLLYRARQEEGDAGPASSQRMTLPVADLLQRWLQHVPVPQTRVVRCYGLSHPAHREALARCPGPPGATARGRAGASGVADRVCPAWRRPSSTVSGLRPAAGVHRGHPAGGRPAAGAGGGTCRMRVSQRGTACQGRGVPAARPVGAGGVAGTVMGRREVVRG